jgi:hypothetical protein
VDGTVDHEGGFFFEVFAQAGVEPIQFLDYATEVPQTSTVNSRTPPVYRRLKPRRHSLVGTDPPDPRQGRRGPWVAVSTIR